MKKYTKEIIIIILMFMGLISPLFNNLLFEGVTKIFFVVASISYLFIYNKKELSIYLAITSLLALVSSFNFVANKDMFDIFYIITIINFFKILSKKDINFESINYLLPITIIILLININFNFSFSIIESNYLPIFLLKLYVIFILFFNLIKIFINVLGNNKKIDIMTFSLLMISVILFLLIFYYSYSQIYLAIVIGLLNIKIKTNKVIFISSTGGHLSELLELSSLFNQYDSVIITEKTETTSDLKNQYKKVYYLIFGTKDHILTYPFKFLLNIFSSFIIYSLVNPKLVVTTGTHTAVPISVINKLYGGKLIYIETFANRYSKTLTGRMLYRISDTFIVQWEEMLELYPKAVYGGWIY